MKTACLSCGTVGEHCLNTETNNVICNKCGSVVKVNDQLKGVLKARGLVISAKDAATAAIVAKYAAPEPELTKIRSANEPFEPAKRKKAVPASVAAKEAQVRAKFNNSQEKVSITHKVEREFTVTDSFNGSQEVADAIIDAVFEDSED